MPQHKTIKNNNAYLASFPELNINPILEIDREGNLQYQNPACQRAFPDIGTLGLKHPLFTDWVKVLKELQAMKPGQPVTREISVGNSVYEQTYFLINKKQIRIYGRDITKRQHAEQALQSAQAILRASHDNSPPGIRIVSEDGQTIYANRALLDIFGSSTAEIDSVPYDKLYTPETYAAHLEGVRKGQSGEPVPPKYEIDIVRKNGEIKRIMINRGDVLWNGEQRYQMLYQDITERVQAEKALQASYDKLDKTLDAVIQTIALTVEIRDPYTAGHQHGVARLASAIAEEMGLTQEKINGMRVVGAIHDIGKICVPAEILSEPGRITEAEFSIIKEHPKTGYDILKGIDFPWPAALAVLQHHERLNGSGYPNRLSGDSIILEARVLAVSDVVEAMASHRPYRRLALTRHWRKSPRKGEVSMIAR